MAGQTTVVACAAFAAAAFSLFADVPWMWDDSAHPAPSTSTGLAAQDGREAADTLNVFRGVTDRSSSKMRSLLSIAKLDMIISILLSSL